MTEAEKTKGARSRTAKADGADAGATATKPAAKKAEKGTDLLAALMQRVEEQVPGVKRSPNKSETYTRLQKDGKTFAYIFPPRQSGLAVKIPKQLLEVEGELPKNHGFHRTNWGLTRTITKASEAPAVAKSFAVAASRVAPAAAAAQEDGPA